ncbi:MAG: hypothetical protein CSA33_07420 [Desulfobulbus propionicus]|nr:MAG: hypothetical protein CSA33_07420 [Desulfobulbus propionicus]
MLVLSPSKGQNFDQPASTATYTQPIFLDQSEKLIRNLRGLNVEQLREKMHISEKLAILNRERYLSFQAPFTPQNAKQALYAFTGDVYTDIAVEQYTAEDLHFSQQHLRILSGLYGCLRPLDLIQPYRLEMKTALETHRGKNLYRFWGNRVAKAITEAAQKSGSSVLFNLASSEYYKVIKNKALQVPVLDIQFKDEKAGNLRIIAIFAKRARGKMADFIIRNKITEPQQLQAFTGHGYAFNQSLSTESRYVFTRQQP